ncbi:MAG: YkgJ family cysteine cluster protein [Desulfofustis sp.]|nr:YkgJ family cysteine cluster protein [Desulfofustis sp.]
MISLLQTWRTLLRGGMTLFLLRICGRDLIRTGSCRCCGCCCQLINLRVGGRWLTSSAQFDRVVQDHPQYRQFVVNGVDHQGLLQLSCTLLRDDGRCGDYENRPALCRSFPTKSLVLCGGVLPPSCGYVITSAVPFAKRLQTAQRRHGRKKDSPA